MVLLESKHQVNPPQMHLEVDFNSDNKTSTQLRVFCVFCLCFGEFCCCCCWRTQWKMHNSARVRKAFTHKDLRASGWKNCVKWCNQRSRSGRWSLTDCVTFSPFEQWNLTRCGLAARAAASFSAEISQNLLKCALTWDELILMLLWCGFKCSAAGVSFCISNCAGNTWNFNFKCRFVVFSWRKVGFCVWISARFSLSCGVFWFQLRLVVFAVCIRLVCVCCLAPYLQTKPTLCSTQLKFILKLADFPPFLTQKSEF